MVSFAGKERRDSADPLEPVHELLMSMPVAVARVRAPDLVYEWANKEYRRVVGDRAPAGRPMHEVLPGLSAEHLQAVRQVVMTGQEHRRREPESWIRRPGRDPEPVFVVFAYQPVRDVAGNVTGVLQYATDVTRHVRDRHRLEALAELSTATEERYRTLFDRLRDANVLGVVVADEVRVLEANDAYLDIIGYTREEFDSKGIDRRSLTPPEWAGSDEDAIGQLRRTGVYQPYEKEYVRRDGRRVPILVGGAVTDWHPLRWAAFAVDLTARQRAEDERATLLAREHAARTEADVAQERLEFLLRAGDLVAATRNRDDLLEKVTELVVPALADYCVAFTPVAGGKLRATKLTHREPAKGDALKLLRERPIPAMGPLIVQKAFATGTTQVAREFTARTPRWSDAEPGLVNLADKVNPTSALAVPLVVGEQPLGVLLLGRGEPRPLFAETDVAIVEELARRLAAGLANVETFAREHTVAETLQRALLPAALPTVPGLDLAVHYLPASDGVHVGGDWYDAFPLSRGRVGLVIGDVAGHSIESASVMGQIRSLLHGYAIDDAAPADVLRRTNAAVSQMLPDAVATACYAVLDTATGDLDYASAGHPPILVATDRGPTEYLECPPGIMLGVSAGAAFAASHRRLQPGAALLLYTDGLVEHRHLDIADGLAALRTAVEQACAQTAEQLCELVQTAVIGSAPRADDVCILAARLPDLFALPGAFRMSEFSRQASGGSGSIALLTRIEWVDCAFGRLAARFRNGALRTRNRK
jgi:PAS domain S-box-containing protein